ncbi:hypothetical protein AGMMS49574_16820 [Bacteroidia bacterium]|nr:hypothetical protein AGMMS49574_16820 [Bacteroidia bacterium]
MAGQNVKISPISELPVSQRGYELRAAAATDSSITYSLTGEYVYKTVTMKDGDSFSEKRYKWENNKWIEDSSVPSTTFYTSMEKPEVVVVSGELHFILPSMDSFGYWYWDADVPHTTKYDENNYLTEFHIGNNFYSFFIRYDNLNRVIALDHYDWEGDLIETYRCEYYADTEFKTFFEQKRLDKATGKWSIYGWGKKIREYKSFKNTDGSTSYFIIMHEEYIPDSNGNLTGKKYDIKYDDNRKKSIMYHYVWYGNRWTQIQYTIFYPNNLIPNISLGYNPPVYGTNKGSFDLGTIVLPDSVSKASFTIKFPTGFALDKDSTQLPAAWSDYELLITPQDSNQWLVTIQRKSLRSALRAETGTTLAHIVYTVDGKVKRGTHDITVHSIQVETPGGNTILEPAITVPAQLNRWGVGNEVVPSLEPTLYVTGHTLYVQSSRAEHITVYSINGLKLYESEVPAGTATIDAARFPKGVLIVRGSSGWARKTVNN